MKTLSKKYQKKTTVKHTKTTTKLNKIAKRHNIIIQSPEYAVSLSRKKEIIENVQCALENFAKHFFSHLEITKPTHNQKMHHNRLQSIAKELKSVL